MFNARHMTTTGAILLVAVFLLIVFYCWKKSPGNRENHITKLIKKANTMGYATVPVRVAGISYRGEEAYNALRNASDDSLVTLVAEPTNRRDKNAVKVLLDEVHIGYVPREFSYSVAKNLKYLAYINDPDIMKNADSYDVYIEIVFNLPAGLTESEFDYIEEHAPERLAELVDPERIVKD